MNTAQEIQMWIAAAELYVTQLAERIQGIIDIDILADFADLMLAEMRGVKFTKHARRWGARGRKRALMAARWWRPPVKLKIRFPDA